MSECKFVLGYICTFARAHIKENLPGHISGSRLLCFARGAGRGHGSLPDLELRLDELAVVGAKYAKFAQIAIFVTSKIRNSLQDGSSRTLGLWWGNSHQ